MRDMIAAISTMSQCPLNVLPLFSHTCAPCGIRSVELHHFCMCFRTTVCLNYVFSFKTRTHTETQRHKSNSLSSWYIKNQRNFMRWVLPKNCHSEAIAFTARVSPSLAAAPSFSASSSASSDAITLTCLQRPLVSFSAVLHASSSL